ncbi:MAG: hypothetical protein HY329_15650 [Chloroflexi bacterium]|nr:hypothetical protein [Chloroflexota bacterium]
MVEQAGIDGVTLFSPGSGQRVTYSRLSDYYEAMSEHELAAAARKKESSSRP